MTRVVVRRTLQADQLLDGDDDDGAGTGPAAEYALRLSFACEAADRRYRAGATLVQVLTHLAPSVHGRPGEPGASGRLDVTVFLASDDRRTVYNAVHTVRRAVLTFVGPLPLLVVDIVRTTHISSRPRVAPSRG